MDKGLTLLGALDALFFFGGILTVFLLPGWLQSRHREAARRQIALTEALDSDLGPIVAPVVKKSIWGPWRIEIVVPGGRWDTVGKILAAADDLFSNADGVHALPYKLVLVSEHDTERRTRGPRAGQAAGRLAGRPAAA
jgi:hypothetical protein